VAIPVVIIGGGISGLSAAWKLKKAGFHEFQLFELERVRRNAVRKTGSPFLGLITFVPTVNRSGGGTPEVGVIEGCTSGTNCREGYLCFVLKTSLSPWPLAEGLLPLVGATRKIWTVQSI
jgi:hypothetical protein